MLDGAPTVDGTAPPFGETEPPEVSRRRIVDALAATAGNQTRAARALGLSRFQLMRRLEALGVPRPRKA